jgi:hypothetical protein
MSRSGHHRSALETEGDAEGHLSNSTRKLGVDGLILDYELGDRGNDYHITSCSEYRHEMKRRLNDLADYP